MQTPTAWGWGVFPGGRCPLRSLPPAMRKSAHGGIAASCGTLRPRRRTLTRGVRMQPTVMLRRPRGSRLRGLTPRCSCTSRRPFPNCAAVRTWRGPCRLARACAFDAQPASVLLSAHASALRSRLRICSVCSARKRKISSSSCSSLLATPPPRRLQSRPFASSARPD